MIRTNINKEKIFRKAEDCINLLLNPEKIMSELVLFLSIANIIFVGFFGGEHVSMGIIMTAAIFVAFLAIKRIYGDDYRSWPVFLISMAALFNSAVIYAYVFQYSENGWIEAVSFAVYCLAAIVMIMTVNSYTCVSDEDSAEQTRRESGICG